MANRRQAKKNAAAAVNKEAAKKEVKTTVAEETAEKVTAVEKVAEKAAEVKEAVKEKVAEVKEIKNPKKTKEKVKTVNDFIYKDLANKMKEVMGTKVSIASKGNGKGKIEIEYYSDEELERMFDMIMSIGKEE